MWNLIILILLSQGTTTTSEVPRSTPQGYAACQCEKGDKGEPGVCPMDCGRGECLGPRMNLERLTQSIRQLIIETKKIAYRNARAMPCICPIPPMPYPVFFPDPQMYFRFQGGGGVSCHPAPETNVRVFPSLQDALLASCTYPDHTYVHIVNEQGRLQGVFIRVQGQLIPIKLENEETLPVPNERLPTAISIPKPKCTFTLPCPRLHLFALGPHIRTMCHPHRPNVFCSKLSDYDDLCARVAHRAHLRGFYRAFLSTSTQWLARLFDGVCQNARIMNMQEEVLYESFEDIFEGKAPLNEILDVQGYRPQFQYWWHGSFPNGTASSDTCLDWSRQDSSYSGLASSLSSTLHGLFSSSSPWPCSMLDSNLGIFCIETNCDKQQASRR